MSEEPRYRVLTAIDEGAFEFDLNHYAKEGWRIVVAGPTTDGWYAIMKKPEAIEFHGTVWEKGDYANADYGVNLREVRITYPLEPGEERDDSS